MSGAQPPPGAAGSTTAGDPSMEDILASIRRILSEDETSPSAGASPPQAGTPPQGVDVPPEVPHRRTSRMLSPAMACWYWIPP